MVGRIPWITKNDRRYLELANKVSQKSTCKSSKYGAVIVKEEGILGTGWNGATNFDFQTSRDTCREGGCYRCDKRANGLIGPGTSLDECVCGPCRDRGPCTMPTRNFTSRLYKPIDPRDDFMISYNTDALADPRGATLYIQSVPCIKCARACIQFRIARVVAYDNNYPKSGKDLLESADIMVDVVNA